MTRAATSLLNPLVTAFTGALVCAFLLSLGYRTRPAVLSALAYGLSTIAWPYAQSFSSEPLAGLLLFAAFFALLRATVALGPQMAGLRRPGGRAGCSDQTHGPELLCQALGGYLVAGLGSRCAAPGAASLGARPPSWLRWRCAWRRCWATITSDSAPRLTRATAPRAGTSLPGIGLYGLLASPGKGLLWYDLPLILSLLGATAFFRRSRAEALCVLGLALTWVGFHAPYDFWEGGWSWGPRLLVPLLPFLVLPVAPAVEFLAGERQAIWRVLPALCLVLGLAVQLPAVGSDYTRYLWSMQVAHPEDAYARASSTVPMPRRSSASGWLWPR